MIQKIAMIATTIACGVVVAVMCVVTSFGGNTTYNNIIPSAALVAAAELGSGANTTEDTSDSTQPTTVETTPVVETALVVEPLGVEVLPVPEEPSETTTLDTEEETTQTTTKKSGLKSKTNSANKAAASSCKKVRTEFPDASVNLNPDLSKYILDESEKYGVPANLVYTVCWIESGFRTKVNNAGLNKDGTTDWGIMGLNDKYIDYNCMLYNNGKRIDMLDGFQNVHIGTQILARLWDTYDGSAYDVFCAYNLGEAGWKKKKASQGSWYYGDKALEYYKRLNSLD